MSSKLLIPRLRCRLKITLCMLGRPRIKIEGGGRHSRRRHRKRHYVIDNWFSAVLKDNKYRRQCTLGARRS